MGRKRLADRIQALRTVPALIVIDALARCFVGGEENFAREMGEFVDGLAWMRSQTQAASRVPPD